MNMLEMQREARELLAMRLEPPESADRQLLAATAGIGAAMVRWIRTGSMEDTMDAIKYFVGAAYVLGQRGSDPVDLEAIFGDALSQEGG